MIVTVNGKKYRFKYSEEVKSMLYFLLFNMVLCALVILIGIAETI